MAELPQVALVGRPNVGKSRLFNRLVGQRLAIVHDRPGVTRDILAADVGSRFTLLDTGGIGLPEKDAPAMISEAVENQVFVAVESSRLILFVVDAREGLTPLDEEIASQLRHRARCPIWIVANKADNEALAAEVHPFLRFGFGDPRPVSAEHRIGIDSLFRDIHEGLGIPEDDDPGTAPQAQAERPIRIALLGKPNVGKSSLGNRLLRSERLIVSDVPGTTRDAISHRLTYRRGEGDSVEFELVDTAGLRAKHKVDSSVEYFSTLRSRRAIENSDVVFLLLDATTGVTRQDKAIAGEILEAGRALVMVVNKWDLALEAQARGELEGYKSIEDFRRGYLEAVHKELFFLPDSPVLFVSAQTGFSITSLLDQAVTLHARLDSRLPTGGLNRTLRDLMDTRPPKRISGSPFKLFYAVQTGNRPFWIRIFCNHTEKLEDGYRRYLENGLIREFDLRGCPVRFGLVGKERRRTMADRSR